MQSQSLVTDIWLAGVALQALLALMLGFRRMWSKFPLFAVYCVFNLLLNILLYVLSLLFMRHLVDKVFYRYTYAIGTGISFILGLGIVYEIFRKLLTAYSALQRMATLLFRWGFVILILVSIAVVYSHNSIDVNSVTAATVVLQEAARIVEVGLLLLLFLFAGVFGLHWRQSVFGIALGLGMFVAVDLVGIAIVGWIGKPAMHAVDFIRVVAFDVTLLVWLGYLLAPENRLKPPDDVPRLQLEQWNRALMELIHV